jgi:hypothetical protein
MVEAVFAHLYSSSCFARISAIHLSLLDSVSPFKMLRYLMQHQKTVVCSAYLDRLQTDFFE